MLYPVQDFDCIGPVGELLIGARMLCTKSASTIWARALPLAQKPRQG